MSANKKLLDKNKISNLDISLNSDESYNSFVAKSCKFQDLCKAADSIIAPNKAIDFNGYEKK